MVGLRFDLSSDFKSPAIPMIYRCSPSSDTFSSPLYTHPPFHSASPLHQFSLCAHSLSPFFFTLCFILFLNYSNPNITLIIPLKQLFLKVSGLLAGKAGGLQKIHIFQSYGIGYYYFHFLKTLHLQNHSFLSIKYYLCFPCGLFLLKPPAACISKPVFPISDLIHQYF